MGFSGGLLVFCSCVVGALIVARRALTEARVSDVDLRPG